MASRASASTGCQTTLPEPISVAHIATVDISVHYLLLGLLCSLRDAGYRVTGISAPGPNVAAVEVAGIPHIPVAMTRRISPFSDLRSLWELYRVLRQKRFAIVHTHTPKAGLLGRLAAWLAGVPIVVHTHHGFAFREDSTRLKRLFFVVLERIAARHCDLILSVNREDLATIVHEGIASPDRAMLLGDGGIGIDIDRFSRARISQDQIDAKRAELRMPAGSKVIGFVGRLVRDKGLLELFAALALVRPKVPGIHLLVVGPVDTAKPDAVTPDAAFAYGISDICTFTGQRNDTPELYAMMDLLVLPSHREGFPLTLAEAAAMQVPVIATDVRGCREAVEHGRNGLLVPLGDVQALAAAICALLADPTKARHMGGEGRILAQERFDQQLVFAKVRAEYARLLRQKGLQPPEPGVRS